MTAHAVGSPSIISSSPKGAPANTAQTPASMPFEHQLHAARLRGGSVAKDHASDHATHPQQGPDSGRDRPKDPSRLGSDARHTGSDTGQLDKSRDETSGTSDTPSTAPSDSHAAATATAVPRPAATPIALAMAEAVAGVASNQAATVEAGAGDNEEGAAALIGAMLALIGPAAGKVLTTDAAGTASSPGKSVATNAASAVLLQVTDANAITATANLATTAIPAQIFAAEGLLLDPKSLRDSAQINAAAAPVLSAAATVAPAAPASAVIPVPVGSPGFAQELGQQVTWYVGHDVKQARIRLHPEELGSLDVKISVNHGRVDVVFHAQHPGAVAAVQQSLPQLDQMLAQHGLSLGNTEVGQQDRGNHRGHAERGDNVAEITEAHGPSLITPLGQLSLLDAFA